MRVDLRAEFKILLNTQQFFSNLSVGDTKLLNDLGAELLRLEKWFSNDKILTIDKQDMGEILARVRFELDSLDRHLPVATLRRHFEQVNNSDKETLETLLKFYLSKKNKTSTDRDKVDLIVTRWGRNTLINEDGISRKVPDILDRLNNIYINLDLPLVVIDGEMAAITALQKERMALLNIKSLRELIDRQVLLRVRKIKDEMEAIFFQPTVLTELVEVNIGLHNVFQKLLAAEQPRLSANNEIKKIELKQPEVFVNSSITSVVEKNVNFEQNLLSTLEEIGQTLSNLTLQVQMLTEKLRGQKNKSEDNITF